MEQKTGRSKKMNSYLKNLIVVDVSNACVNIESYEQLLSSRKGADKTFWEKHLNKQTARREMGLKVAENLGIELPETLTTTPQNSKKG